MQNTIKISVIIATYNRAHIIDHCLQSLAEQTASQNNFEVIVIDNNSTDNTHKVVHAFKDQIANLVFINEPQQGAGHARNAGIAAAQGEWIACLDSDAKAHKNWIEVMQREIDKGAFDAFGGPYLAWHYYGPMPRWFSEAWESSVSCFDYYGSIPNDKEVPTSGNAAFKKDIIQSVGFFPTEIGMKGDTCAYGEETKLFEDMRNANFRLGSVPDLLIDHCVLPYKYSLKWRLHSAFAHGYAAPYIHPAVAGGIYFPRRVAGLMKQIVLLPYRCVQGVRAKHLWQRIFLDGVNPILGAAGTVYGCAKILLKKILSR